MASPDGLKGRFGPALRRLHTAPAADAVLGRVPVVIRWIGRVLGSGLARSPLGAPGERQYDKERGKPLRQFIGSLPRAGSSGEYHHRAPALEPPFSSPSPRMRAGMPSGRPWLGVEIGEYQGAVRVPRRAFQRLLREASPPERCVLLSPAGPVRELRRAEAASPPVDRGWERRDRRAGLAVGARWGPCRHATERLKSTEAV